MVVATKMGEGNISVDNRNNHPLNSQHQQQQQHHHHHRHHHH